MRPPFGYYDLRVETIMSNLSYKAFLWNFASKDWALLDSSNTLLNHVKTELNKTSHSFNKKSLIILQHDTQKLTLMIQDEMIKYILNKNYTIVKLNQCIGEAHDHNLEEANFKIESKEIKLNLTLRNDPYIYIYDKNLSTFTLNLYYFIWIVTVAVLLLISVIFFDKKSSIVVVFKYLSINIVLK